MTCGGMIFIFFILYLIFLCYYCSIKFKRQSEHSGLRPDTSSLVTIKNLNGTNCTYESVVNALPLFENFDLIPELFTK